MSKRLFVGGLSWNTNDDGLRAAFTPFGTVTEARVIVDRDTGRSRGFGFVTMPDDAEADAAVAQMDGAAIDGRNVRVNEAQDRSGGGGGAPRRGPPRGDRRGPPPGVERRGPPRGYGMDRRGPPRDFAERRGPPRSDDGPPRDRPPLRRGPGGPPDRGPGGPSRFQDRQDDGYRRGPSGSFPPQGGGGGGGGGFPGDAGDDNWAQDRDDRRRPRKGKKKKKGRGDREYEDGYPEGADSRKKRGTGRRGRSGWDEWEGGGGGSDDDWEG